MLQLDEKQTELFEWVKVQHGDQKRKYTGQPYWYHLEEVATIVQSILPKNLAGSSFLDINYTAEISLCHDLLEDVEELNRNSIYSKLRQLNYNSYASSNIVEGIVCLTDAFTSSKYPHLNRQQRKTKEAFKLSTVPEFIQTIKYADLISNTSTIVQYDPGFARVYLAEKRHLLSVMKNGNFTLYAKAIQLLCNWEDLLNNSETKLKQEDQNGEKHY